LFEIGASLAAARESKGLSFTDAENLTCLRARYLEAMEADRFEDLPGHVYARAFLRTYAAALGLDAEQYVDEFASRYPEPEDEPLAVVPRSRRRLPVGLALVAAAVVGLVAAIAWSGSSHPRQVAPIRPPARPAPPPVHKARARPQPPPHPAKPKPLLIRAVGGDCWLLVRRGGETGPVLYEGLLQPGQTVRFRPRVWVRLGAPWNVVLRRGTHAIGLSRTQVQNLVA
jgi:helix-turn-helix protein